MALRERMMLQRVGILDWKRYFRDLMLTFGPFFGSAAYKDSLFHKFNAIQGLAGAENPTRKKHPPPRLLNKGVKNICRQYKTGEKIHFYRSFAEKKNTEKTFLFAIWFSNSSFSFPSIIQLLFSVDVFTELQLTGARLRPPPCAKVAHCPSLLLFCVAKLEPCPRNYRTWQRHRSTFWRSSTKLSIVTDLNFGFG